MWSFCVSVVIVCLFVAVLGPFAVDLSVSAAALYLLCSHFPPLCGLKSVIHPNLLRKIRSTEKKLHEKKPKQNTEVLSSHSRQMDQMY